MWCHSQRLLQPAQRPQACVKLLWQHMHRRTTWHKHSKRRGERCGTNSTFGIPKQNTLVLRSHVFSWICCVLSSDRSCTDFIIVPLATHQMKQYEQRTGPTELELTSIRIIRRHLFVRSAEVADCTPQPWRHISYQLQLMSLSCQAPRKVHIPTATLELRGGLNLMSSVSDSPDWGTGWISNMLAAAKTL